MTDWDQDGPDLYRNIEHLLRGFADRAGSRSKPTVAATRDGHRALMRGLAVPGRKYVGNFRGARGLEGVEVRIGRAFGVRSGLVAEHLAQFERELQQRVKQLDDRIKPDRSPTVTQQAEVIELCAWAHAESIRIHPFANGNGRIARLGQFPRDAIRYAAVRTGSPATRRRLRACRRIGDERRMGPHDFRLPQDVRGCRLAARRPHVIPSPIVLWRRCVML